MADPFVVVFHGKAGSGKDTIAKDVALNIKGNIVALADPIKRFLQEMTEIPYNIWWGDSDKRNHLVELHCEYKAIPRIGLTSVGDALIEFSGTSLPALYLASQLRHVTATHERMVRTGRGVEYDPIRGWLPLEHNKGTHVLSIIIPDLRFPEEYRILKAEYPDAIFIKIGGCINPLSAELAKHKSEDGLDDKLFDHVVNNECGSLYSVLDNVNGYVRVRHAEKQEAFYDRIMGKV